MLERHTVNALSTSMLVHVMTDVTFDWISSLTVLGHSEVPFMHQRTVEFPDTCLCAQNESNMLEQHVVNVRTHIHAMTEDPSNKERLYVTNEDIVKLASIGRDTVFAVTAPQGTSLIVPDPDKTAPGQPPQYRCVPTYPSRDVSVLWYLTSILWFPRRMWLMTAPTPGNLGSPAER